MDAALAAGGGLAPGFRYRFLAVGAGLTAFAFRPAPAVIGKDAFQELLVDRLGLIDLVCHATSRQGRQRRLLQV